MYETIGMLAAFIGAIMYIPQTWRVVKTRHTKDISLMTYILLFIVCILWIVYGYGVYSYPIMFVNLVISLLTSVILTIKIKEDIIKKNKKSTCND